MKQKNLFLFFNVAIPLIFGLSIYLFCYKTTYINTIIENLVDISLPYFYYDNIFYSFLTCWACDILWAYALTFALFFCLKDYKNGLFFSSLFSISLSFIIEFLQINGYINGTFDIWDIILEISAIFVAVIIIKRSFLK
ncbi:MAG: hypothetical protein IJZ16_01490 [Clostridia bacterium]|nr:hypothetical protein [Clostridia bacterium]